MNDTKRIYLAAPYSHESFRIRQERFNAVSKKCAELMKSGHIVFSPITHSHYLGEECGLPNDPGFWKRWYVTFLEHWATDLYVYKLPNWDKSKGVQTEIEYAGKLGLPVTYFEAG